MDITLTFTYEAYKANKQEIDKLLVDTPLDGWPFKQLTIRMDASVNKVDMPGEAFEKDFDWMKYRYYLTSLSDEELREETPSFERAAALLDLQLVQLRGHDPNWGRSGDPL